MALKTTQIRFKADGGETTTIGNQSISIPQSGGFYEKTIKLTNGTGAGKAQKWAAVSISLAAAAQTTINLQAVATGVLGVAVNFTNVKAMIVENSNTDQEVDTVTITGSPTGGTFTITVAGQTTSALAYNAVSTTTVQTAVQALSTVGTGNATVTGSAGGPYTIIFAASLGAMTVTASGASLTGGSTPSATAARVPSDLVIGDDSSGTNVWSALFKGTNARLVCQPGESIQKATTTKAGYAVDSTHKNLLLTNAGSVALTGLLLLCGEGS